MIFRFAFDDQIARMFRFFFFFFGIKFRFLIKLFRIEYLFCIFVFFLNIAEINWS